MTRLVSSALAVLLAASGFAIPTDASAAARDTDGNRGNCMKYEYKSIHKGDSLHKVRLILGGTGIVEGPKGREGTETRRWASTSSTPGSTSASSLSRTTRCLRSLGSEDESTPIEEAHVVRMQRTPMLPDVFGVWFKVREYDCPSSRRGLVHRGRHYGGRGIGLGRSTRRRSLHRIKQCVQDLLPGTHPSAAQEVVGRHAGVAAPVGTSSG